MTMLQRCARALWAEWHFDEDATIEDLEAFWILDDKEMWMDQARAVLQALREPTTEMSRAAENAVAEAGDWSVSAAIWQAMIDAILDER